MNEAFYPVLNASESTEVNDIGDGTLDDLSDLILLLGHVPGIRLQTLEAKANPLPVTIDPQHVHLDLFPDLEHVPSMLDALPRQLRDVDQAVGASEVHESAELTEIPHLARTNIPLLELLQELILPLITPLARSRTLGQNQPAPLAIYLYDLEQELLPFHLGQHPQSLLVTAPPAQSAELRRRHKTPYLTKVDQESALVVPRNRALEYLALL